MNDSLNDSRVSSHHDMERGEAPQAGQGGTVDSHGGQERENLSFYSKDNFHRSIQSFQLSFSVFCLIASSLTAIHYTLTIASTCMNRFIITTWIQLALLLYMKGMVGNHQGKRQEVLHENMSHAGIW